MDIKHQIRERREALGWSKKQLSLRLGMAGDSIGKIEAGTWEPRLETLREIGRFFRSVQKPFDERVEEFLGIAVQALKSA
jgi:predicted transcriptional regulator